MKTYHNPVTGDVMKVLQSSKGREDGKFIIEVTLQPFADWAKVYHYHPNTTETFKVHQGELSMKLNGTQIVLKPENDKVIVPPRMGHCFWNHTDHVVTFMAGRNEKIISSGEQLWLLSYYQGVSPAVYEARNPEKSPLSILKSKDILRLLVFEKGKQVDGELSPPNGRLFFGHKGNRILVQE